MSQTYADIIKKALELYPNIEDAAKEEGLTGFDLLSRQINRESSGDAYALSWKGAQGLMQLMPETAAELGVEDPYDPEQNILGGARYLSQQLDAFGGEIELALAAYNAGARNVKDYGGVPPFEETQLYVQKILGRGLSDVDQLQKRQRSRMGPDERAALEQEDQFRLEKINEFMSMAGAIRILDREGHLPPEAGPLVLPNRFFNSGGVQAMTTDQLVEYLQYADGFVDFGIQNKVMKEHADEIGPAARIAQVTWRNLVGTAIGAGQLVAEAGGRAMNLPGFTPLIDPAMAAARTDDPAKAVAKLEKLREDLMEGFGIPRDPEFRERYFGAFPFTSTAVGELVSFGIMAAAVPNPASLLGRGVAGAGGAAARGSLSRAVARMSPFMRARAARIAGIGGRTPLGTVASSLTRATSRGIGTAKGTFWVGGAGYAAGHLGHMMMEPDAETLDHFRAGVSGMMGGILLWTGMMGRPVGVVAREAFASEVAGTMKLWQSIPQAMRMSQRLTLGHMTGAGTVGAVWGVQRALDQGKDQMEALTEGVQVGAEWMAGDLMLSRLGGLGRLARVHTFFRDTLAKRLQQTMSLNQALNRAGLAQAAADGVIGGGVGAAAGAVMNPEDPLDGALKGGLIGAPFTMWLLHRGAPSIVPKALLRKLAEGGRLNGDELAFLARWHVYSAAREVATQVEDEAISEAVRRAAGTMFETSPMLTKINQELALAEQAFMRATGGIETLPRSPEAVKAAAAAAGRVLTLRERRAQVLRQIRAASTRAEGPVTYSEGAVAQIRRGPRAVEEGGVWVRTRPSTAALRSAVGASETLDQKIRNTIARNVADSAAARDARRAALEMDEEIRKQASVRASEAAAREAADKEIIAAASRREALTSLKSRMTQEAYDWLGERTPKEIWDELAVGMGMEVGKVKSIFQRDLAQARLMLARLRAENRQPLMKLEKSQPLAIFTDEVQKEADEMFSIIQYVDDVIAAGEGAVEANLLHIAKNLKGTLSRIRENGVNKKMLSIPGVGEFTSAWTMDLLHQVRDALKSFRYDLLAVAGAATLGGYSMAEANVRVDGAFVDHTEDGENRLAWVPNAAAVAALGALGIVLRKGVPTNVRNIMRAALKKSKDVERVFILKRDGTALALRGGKANIPLKDYLAVDARYNPKTKQLFIAADRSLMFTVHNHPVEAGAPGMNLLNKFPSDQDLMVFALHSQPDAAHVIIAPDGTATLFQITDPQRFLPSVSKDLKLVPKSATDKALSFMKSMGRVEGKNWEATMRALVRKYGAGDSERRLVDLYEAMGVKIRTNVPIEEIESAYQAARARTAPFRATSTTEALEAGAAARVLDTGVDLERLSSREFRDTLRREFGLSASQRKVAPKGARGASAPLQSSITSQGVTSTGISFVRLRDYLRQNHYDLSLTRGEGRTVYTAKDPNGKIISVEPTLHKTVDQVASHADRMRDRVALGLNQSPFEGKVGGGIGTFLGAWFGASMQNWLMDDPDSTIPGMVAGAFAGYLAGALAGAKLSGYSLSASGKAALKFFKPEDVHLKDLTDTAVNPKVGGTTVKKHEFLGWTENAQVMHLWRRISKIRAKSIDRDAKLKEIRDAIRRFTPNTLGAENYDKLRASVYNNLRAIDVDDADIEMVWRGMIGNMLTSYEKRVGITAMPLWELGRRVPNFSDDELRRRVLQAEIISGPPPPVPDKAKVAMHEALARSLTPQAENLKEAAAVAASKDTLFRDMKGPVETGGRYGIPIMGKLLPTERFRTLGEQMLNAGDATGSDIVRLFDALYTSTNRMRTEFADETLKLNQIFEGLELDQRRLVRVVLEKPDSELAINAVRDNPRLGEAAVQFKALLDKWADRVFPKEIRVKEKVKDAATGKMKEVEVVKTIDRSDWAIEKYFPYYYSQRTIRKIMEEGGRPRDISLPLGSSIPEYKLWRSMFARSGDPLGEIIDDPLQAGAIYLNGAIRKANLDNVAAEFDGRFFKNLMKSQPIVAADMARWYLDVFGVPSTEYVWYMGHFKSIGMKLEQVSAFGFNTSEFGKEIIDRYFMSRDAVHRFTRFVRGFEFYTKLGWSWVSSLVNASQLYVNSGTDVGFNHLFMGGVPFMFRTAQGKMAELFPGSAGFIDRHASGRAKLALARRIGIFSDNTKRVLDELAQREAEESTHVLGLSVGVGLTGLGVGAVAGGAIGGAADADPRATAALGASIGSGFAVASAMMQPKLLRRGLQYAADTIIWPFQMVESLNRGVTAGGARRQIIQQRAMVRKYGAEEAARRARRGELVEAVATGAVGGAAVGEVFGEDPLTGAVVGAGLMGATGLGETRHSRVGRMIEQQEQGNIVPLLRKKLKEQGVPTPTEINRWYIRQVLDTTQFRFGREARGQWLRGPTGEVMGALQSFTLNQMEFVGRRYDEFHASMDRAMATGAIDAVDTRFLRHMMLVIATGSATTSLTMGLGSERDPQYWISRIGLGMVPLLSYNEDAKRWNLTDIGSHMTGPFINDVSKAASVVLRMWTDPDAMEAYRSQGDDLARQMFSALRQIEATPEIVGTALEKLHLQGAADLVRAQEDLFTSVARPASTATGEPY